MKKSFAIGDRVCALDEDLEGNVVARTGDRFQIETDDGLRLWLNSDELAPMGEFPDISNFQAFEGGQTKSTVNSGAKKLAYSKKGNRGERILTMDLHIESLPRRFKDADPYDILEYQLDWTRRQIDFARTQGIRRLVIIHGVGQGVLKEEIHALLRRLGVKSYGDAPYHTYGFGATEVMVG